MKKGSNNASISDAIHRTVAEITGLALKPSL
jgi:hypothetical protein